MAKERAVFCSWVASCPATAGVDVSEVPESATAEPGPVVDRGE